MQKILFYHKTSIQKVGNTGDSAHLTMVVDDSFSVRRGEFVRINHRERQDEPLVPVLGRLISLRRPFLCMFDRVVKILMSLISRNQPSRTNSRDTM
jgi:hypothetical protein